MRTSISGWRSAMGALCLLLAMTCVSASAENFPDVCKTGTPEQIKAMIDVGADVNAKDKDGNTALDHAREKKNEKAVTALIKAGAQGK